MHAGELVTRRLATCDPRETVASAARRMREARILSLVVRGRPPGLVTASDLRDRVLAAGLSGEVPVQAVMSAPLHTMPAEAALGEVLLCMVDHGIHHLPLVREGRLVGMVTDTDLAAAFEYLQDLRLRHQAGRLQGGATPDDLIVLADLGALERRWLKDAFQLLHTCQEGVRIASRPT